MPYKSVASLQADEPCIVSWLEELNPRTAVDYGYYFLGYRDWFRAAGHWPSAQAMLDDYEGLETPRSRFLHVDILKRYIKSKGSGSSNRRNIWYAVRSFYAFHRLPLPRIPRNETSRLFTPSRKDQRKALELAPLKLDEVRRLILNAPQPYRAALMMMFQSAMGLAEFTHFNAEGWRRVVEQVHEPDPLRIDLFRAKTSRTHVNKFYTFVGEDGKRLVREWLAMRPDTEVDALFVVFNKNRQTWVPLRGRLIGNMVTKVAKRTGLIKPNGLNRYHVHAHEFRDLFKSLCTLNGVNPIASEFFLGHRIDKQGYDKSPEYDEVWFRREYLKVEPQLNIISGTGHVEKVKREVALEAIRRFAEAFGIDPMQVRVAKQKTLGRTPNSEEEIQAIQNEIKKIRRRDTEDTPRKIVAEDELARHLAEGWDVQTVLPSGKILIRK
jgi:hypothetical protein